MKSFRSAALAPKASTKPGRVDLGFEAGAILKRLERARNYGNKRQYNKELSMLIKEHPEFTEHISQLRWK